MCTWRTWYIFIQKQVVRKNQKAIAGEVSSQEALDSVAKQWEKITDRLGRDNQKKMYAAAMGL